MWPRLTSLWLLRKRSHLCKSCKRNTTCFICQLIECFYECHYSFYFNPTTTCFFHPCCWWFWEINPDIQLLKKLVKPQTSHLSEVFEKALWEMWSQSGCQFHNIVKLHLLAIVKNVKSSGQGHNFQLQLRNTFGNDGHLHLCVCF